MSFQQQPPPSHLFTQHSQTHNFRSLISDMKHDYHKLATRFASLPLAARRSIDRRYISERFNCTAILQFLSNVPELNSTYLCSQGVTPLRCAELPVDEKCPVAREWYATLFAAERQLDELVDSGVLTAEQRVNKVRGIEGNLALAGKGLGLVRDWVNLAMWVEEERDSHSIQGLIGAWNVVCEEVEGAKWSVEKAGEIAGFWLHTRGKPVYEGQPRVGGGERRWFEWCPALPN